MTLRELWEKHKDNADLELLFDMNGDGAAPIRDTKTVLLEDDDGDDGEDVIMLTNIKGLYDDNAADGCG